MRRVLPLVLLVALILAIGAQTAFAPPLPAPPADGTKVPVYVYGQMEDGRYPVYEYPLGSGVWYIDGIFANYTNSYYAGGVTVRNPYLTVEYRNSADGLVSRETFAVPSMVMPSNPAANSYRPVHHRLTVPPGADPTRTWWPEESPGAPGFPNFDYATAASTLTYQSIDLSWSTQTTDADGRTFGTVIVTNNGTEIVGPVVVTGREGYGATGSENCLDSLHVFANVPATAARLFPGESTTFEAYGLNPTPLHTPAYVRNTLSTEAEAYPLPDTTVYRFYNVRTGAHFYTHDPAERDTVLATLGAIYHLDGPAYAVVERHPDNAALLWRFYNRRTGTHFYTADPLEKADILATMGSIYQLDGPTYYISSVYHAGYGTVWRFYNLRTGTHFYTSDPGEMARVRDTMAATYHLDGPAFYLAR
jgi:hypothetical protein